MPRLFEHIVVRSARDLNGRLISGSGSGAFVTIIQNGSQVIAAGVAGDIDLPFAGVLTGWRLLADQAGTMTVDLWKDVYANYPPTVADTITAAAKPTLAGPAIKNEDYTLAGWTRNFAAGDTIRINIDAATVVTRVLLSLYFDRV